MTRGAPWLVAALLAVSAAGVAQTQPRLATTVHEIKEREDIYALPPPGQLHRMALGYDAALVDLLWAKLLIEYGVHWAEKRDMHPDVYLDTILAIDPKYGPAYRFADTLLCYRPLHGTDADARKARALLEQGTRERPGDWETWLQLGQFSLYLGPSFLTDEAEKARWRLDGARALTHVAELGGDESIAVAAASILGRSGARDAAIDTLRRSYALTDDPERQAEILRKLEALEASAGNEAAQHAVDRVNSMWRRDLPFLSHGEFLLLGPAPPAARCAGPDAADEGECARDWPGFLSQAP